MTAATRRWRRSRVLFAVVVMLLIAQGTATVSASAAPLPGEQAGEPAVTVATAMAVQERITDSMLERPGVVGTGVAVASDGAPRIVVFLEAAADAAQVPDQIDGVATTGTVSGAFVAFADCPTGSKGRCARPVPAGVSTGHPGITAGTLAALLRDDAGNRYALSNNHIYANENRASIGDPVLQPGPADGGSAANPADVLGTLSDYEPLRFCPAGGCATGPGNTIDAAIAAVSADAVSAATFCGWTPRKEIVPVGSIVPGETAVKKCGRTTGLMSGTVTAVNVTVDVQLRTGTARFVNQIITTDIGDPGDSGSLIVDDANRPVALLFAGSETTTLGNPIGPVLSRFGLSIDDGSPQLDTTPPAPPLGLSAAIEATGVRLDWSDNPEPDLAVYRVYRGGASGGPYTRVGPDLAGSDYVDTTVGAGSTYSYVVTAVDTSGNESPASLEVMMTALALPPPPDAARKESVGLVDPATGAWHLRGSASAASMFYYGNPGDVPFMGDWDCDGIDTPGLYRQSDGFVYLRNENSQGLADITFFFGNPDDIPLAGDFDGDGCDSVSLYRPNEARFYIVNQLGEDGGGLGPADFDYGFGDPGDKPFVGDFDDDGIDTAGLHRESTGLVYFRNVHSAGGANDAFVYGNPGDRILAGDWNGDGTDSPAAFRPADRRWYFRYANASGPADEALAWGEETWLPITGRLIPG